MTILSGIENIPKHFKAWINGEEDLHPDLKVAFSFLQNSAAALLKEELPALQAAKTSMEQNVAAALTGGDKTAAGKAIIATAKTVATKLGDDALHILATDVLAI
jgi:hypothetical protein